MVKRDYIMRLIYEIISCKASLTREISVDFLEEHGRYPFGDHIRIDRLPGNP